MVSTAIQRTNVKSNFSYHPGINFIYRSENRWFQSQLYLLERPDKPLGNCLKVISPNKKALITLNMGMFHFWYDSAGPLLKLVEEHKDIELFIDYSFLHMETDKTLYDFLLKVLDDKGVKYNLIDYQSLDSVVMNNFYAMQGFERIDDSPNVVYRNTSKYRDSSVIPDKVVYLSRRNVGDRTGGDQFISPGLDYYHDERIDDERKLEAYLESLGVTIIAPEDFVDFEEQLKYFNTVKTVISLTSSGLANSIFMQSGGNVIEFITPLVISMFPDESNPGFNHGEISIHNLYNLISYSRNHSHISIANKTRSVDDLINYLEETKIIHRVLSDG